MSFALAGLLLYLWVIHYPILPLAQAGIIIGLIGVFFDARPMIVPVPLRWFGAFVLWSGLAIVHSAYPDIAQEGFVDYLKLWLICLLGVNVAHNRIELRTLTIAWLGLFAFYPVRGTLFNIAYGHSFFGRYAWNNIFENPNDLAALTLPMLALCIGLLQTERGKWIRRAAITGSFLLPIIIFFTQSRGGILALFLFGALVLLRNRRRGRMVVAVAAAAVLVAISVPTTVWSRLAGLKNVTDTENLRAVDEMGSAEQRYEIWKVARAIFRDHAILGTGPGTYPEMHRIYARGGQFLPTARGKRDTHSTYLNVLAEGGLVGFILFVGMLVSVFVAGWRMMRLARRHAPQVETQIYTLLAGLVAFLQASVFATTQHVVFLYLYIAIVCVYLRLAPQLIPGGAVEARPARPALRGA